MEDFANDFVIKGVEMGGYGSGRRRHPDAMQTTDICISLDVREWHRDGLLKQGQRFRYSWYTEGLELAAISVRTCDSFVVMTPLTKGDANSEQVGDDTLVSLAQTSCHYGGSRPWFLCPHCSRRVAVLYVTEGIVCRYCAQLRYKSQCEAPYLRTVRRARKLDLRLGGTGVMGLVRGRPKGMHGMTYRQLADEFNALRTKAWEGVSERLFL